ncbi:ABC transporter permease [Commensalibacter oyaizuii]|uniref:ABC transporter permease n=1 Tax=Commensalibacter oyaizuii TaxID=3043873 RepID=A0ABT6Q1Y3_9PROT|nr:ABC transporter permease [Commensalibacter sp. TBRC 16381]MDI2091089.1 ABC transporter permease [Commensalibacter sp. TBRC 16381]
MTIEKKASFSPEPLKWNFECKDEQSIFILHGDWLSKNDNIPQLPSNIFDHLSNATTIQFDTKHLRSWDSGFITFLWEIKQLSAQHQIKFSDQGLPEATQKLLSLLTENKAPAHTQSKRGFRPLYNLGGWTINALNSLGVTTQLFFLTLNGVFKSFAGRSFMRLADLLKDIKAAGPSALIIISVVNFLVGAILAFVGAVQLRRFSADAYVANLVGIATVREMAAVMTAIVISGRTGGAYAARIATMQGNEEIDALKVMGIPVTEYIILPSMLSLTLTMPLLYLYACFMGIFGGLIVSILMLKVSVIGFLQQTFGAVAFNQFVFGGVKTIAFAMFIGVSSCYIGMKSGRSAADVGIAATKAVVVGIVGVIALDAIFAVIADMIGI